MRWWVRYRPPQLCTPISIGHRDRDCSSRCVKPDGWEQRGEDMVSKKEPSANSSSAWFDQTLNALAQEAKTWREKKEEELSRAENERHAKLAVAYQARLDKAFKSKKSKELMIDSLPFFVESYNGKNYVRFEGTVFTDEEFKERLNYLFREHVENLWTAQLKIEAMEEANQLKLNSAVEQAISAFIAKQTASEDQKAKRSDVKKKTPKESALKKKTRK